MDCQGIVRDCMGVLCNAKVLCITAVFDRIVHSKEVL